MIKSRRVGSNPPLSLFRSTFLCLVAALPAAGQIPPVGFEIVPITDDVNELTDGGAEINNCGQVVFTRQDFPKRDVFLYDNGKLTQLTDDDVWDQGPDINDDGTIVWHRGPNEQEMIVVYQDGVWSELAPGQGPAINNLGHIAWKVFDPTRCASPANVFLFDGETIEQITDDGLSNQGVDINDFDELVWTRYDFCPSPWESDIMLYSGGVIIELPDGGIEPQNPKINNAGLVTWPARDEVGNQIVKVWEDGATWLLTDNGSGPRLNNAGAIALNLWDEVFEVRHAWVFDEGEFVQMADGPVYQATHGLNDFGEIPLAVNYGNQNSDVHLIRRVRTGDVDFDGDVDLDDYAFFVSCVTGPIETDGLCECRFCDIDHDRDVDMLDFLLFQMNFTGKE